jgi:hypothetical protein
VRVPARIAISPPDPGIEGLRSAVRQDPELALVDNTDGFDSVVELVAHGRLEVALLSIDDPGAALAALSKLATDTPSLPRGGIALTGSGATDLAFALRRLGLRAEAIDADTSPAEICGQLARLARLEQV